MRKRLLLLLLLCASPLSADLLTRILADGSSPPENDSVRLILVRELPETFPPHQRERLLRFLREGNPPPEEPAESEATDLNALATLRNNLLVKLHRSDIPPDLLAETLLESWSFPGSDPRWRDFCIQHLGLLAPDLTSPVAARVRVLLLQTLDLTNEAYAGTALLALRDMLPPADLARHSIAVALHLEQSIASRSTALHLLAEASAPPDLAVLTHARTLLGAIPQSDTPTFHSRSLPLRLAAIRLLSAHGGPDDLALLQSFHQNPLPPLRQASLAAADTLRTRFQQAE